MTAYAKIRGKLKKVGLEYRKTGKVRGSDKEIDRLKGIVL